LRELHFQSLLRSKDLEVQYHAMKLEQQRRAQEMESSKSHQLTRQVSTFSQTENELRSQLNIYVEKFKQVRIQILCIIIYARISHNIKVEDTLNSSNDLFLTFRKEMEEMSKKTKRLEKENAALTRKHEATNQSIIKMAEDRSRMLKELEQERRKKESLEKLCRGMQAQGRTQPPLPPPQDPDGSDPDDDRTESEYDYSDGDDDDGSLDNEYEQDKHPSEGPVADSRLNERLGDVLKSGLRSQPVTTGPEGIRV
jgi:taxilin